MYSDCKIKDAPQCWVTTGMDTSGQDQAENDQVKGFHNIFLLSGLVLHPLVPLHSPRFSGEILVVYKVSS